MEKPTTTHKMSRRMQSAVLIGLAAVAVVGAGGAALVTVPAPENVSGRSVVDTIAVNSHEFDDARTVNVTVTSQARTPLTVSAGGVVTEVACTAGGRIESGSAPIRVNGQPVIALTSSVPFWRDVSVGDSGADVSALQNELVRLGYPLDADGQAGRASIAAVADLITRHGGKPAEDRIRLSDLIWIPQPAVTVASCTATLGATVSPGFVLAELPPAVTSINASVPGDAVDGERTLSIDDATVVTDASGAVTDPASLDQLVATAGYRAWEQSDQSSPLTASYALSSPLSVTAVPPAALVGVDGDGACVIDGGATVPVTIVSSELGQSFVVARDGRPIAKVSLRPDEAATCH